MRSWTTYGCENTRFRASVSHVPLDSRSAVRRTARHVDALLTEVLRDLTYHEDSGTYPYELKITYFDQSPRLELDRQIPVLTIPAWMDGLINVDDEGLLRPLFEQLALHALGR